MQEKKYTIKEKEKLILQAAKHYSKFMDVLLPGWKDDSNSNNTPYRVAKSFVEDIAKSLYNEQPNITSFDNTEKYDGIILEANIPVKSLCSHHHQNIVGVCHVAYIPKIDGKIIGLSKLNRIVDYCSRKPQVQENLTMEIHRMIDALCENNIGVAVIIKANHMCCSHRGVNHNSEMQTCKLSKAFIDQQTVREEFYNLIRDIKQH